MIKETQLQICRLSKMNRSKCVWLIYDSIVLLLDARLLPRLPDVSV